MATRRPGSEGRASETFIPIAVMMVIIIVRNVTRASEEQRKEEIREYR